MWGQGQNQWPWKFHLWIRHAQIFKNGHWTIFITIIVWVLLWKIRKNCRLSSLWGSMVAKLELCQISHMSHLSPQIVYFWYLSQIVYLRPFSVILEVFKVIFHIWGQLSRSTTLKFSPLDPPGPNLQKWSLNRFCSSDSFCDMKENM